MVKRFAQASRPGAYLRIVAEGSLAAGDAIEVLSRPEHGVTVRDVSDAILLDEALLEFARPRRPSSRPSWPSGCGSGPRLNVNGGWVGRRGAAGRRSPALRDPAGQSSDRESFGLRPSNCDRARRRIADPGGSLTSLPSRS